MIRAATALCLLSLAGCITLPDAPKGKARANREVWVVSHTIEF